MHSSRTCFAAALALAALTACATPPPVVEEPATPVADPVAAEPVAVDGACPTCGRSTESIPLTWEAIDIDVVPGVWSPRPILDHLPTTPPEELPEEEAREKARVDGRYRQLLRRIEVPHDHAIYGAFSDYGRWSGTAYAGHVDLPTGYWVYVYPHWYIWAAPADEG